MELKEIQELIKFVSKSGVTEVEIEKDGFKLVIKADNKTEAIHLVAPQTMLPQQQIQTITAPIATPVVEAPPTPVAQTSGVDESKLIAVKSPMIGTFYRSSSPDKDPFVQIGDFIEPGSVVCIIEAMKLFNEIESEVKGKIVKICVDNSKPVEYDQPLFLVEPA